MRVFVDARPVPGGIQRSLEELVRRLGRREEVDLVLYRPATSSGAPVNLGSEPQSWIHRQLGGVKRILEERVQLSRRVRRAKPDVFLSPNGLVPGRLGCPSVVQCHDLWLLDHPEAKRGGFVTAYERATLIHALNKADRIVVPSRSVRQEVRDRLPHLSEKLRHIYHPLPPPHTVDGSPNESLPSTPFLLTVGTLEPRKNLERLVEAQRLSWTRTGVPLVLVGPYGWSQRALLTRVAETPGVHWLGAVDEHTLDHLYRRAAAVVQVSLCEGFGYPMVEAMQHGTCLVLSELPVHREIAGDCASFCNAEDPTSISAAIEDVLGWDAQRHESTRDAARQKLSALSDDSLVDRWLHLFHETATTQT